MLNKNNILKACMLAAILCTTSYALADETLGEKVNTGANKGTDSAKKNYRDLKNKGCEMINGKVECAVKKMKNDTKNLSDKVETKATEVKDRVD